MQIEITGITQEAVRRPDFDPMTTRLAIAAAISGIPEHNEMAIPVTVTETGDGQVITIRVTDLDPDTGRQIQLRLDWLLLCVLVEFLDRARLDYERISVVSPHEHLVWKNPATLSARGQNWQISRLVVYIADIERLKNVAIDAGDYGLAAELRTEQQRAYYAKVVVERPAR